MAMTADESGLTAAAGDDEAWRALARRLAKPEEEVRAAYHLLRGPSGDVAFRSAEPTARPLAAASITLQPEWSTTITAPPPRSPKLRSGMSSGTPNPPGR